MKKLDLMGKTFGKLTVVGAYINDKHGHARWKCKCSCGNSKLRIVNGDNLIRGRTKQCSICRLAQFRKSVIGKVRKKPCKYEHWRKPVFMSVVNELYNNYKNQCKRNGREFLILKELFHKLITSNCEYCGIPPNREYKNGKQKQYTWKVNGVDRIDNDIGYLDSNVVSCCAECNRMKNTLNKDVFLDRVTRIYNNIRKGLYEH